MRKHQSVYLNNKHNKVFKTTNEMTKKTNGIVCELNGCWLSKVIAFM